MQVLERPSQNESESTFSPESTERQTGKPIQPLYWTVHWIKQSSFCKWAQKEITVVGLIKKEKKSICLYENMGTNVIDIAETYFLGKDRLLC